jgi:hypothetical protein
LRNTSRRAGVLAAGALALAACAPDDLASPRSAPTPTAAVAAATPAADGAGLLATTPPRLAYAYSTQWEWWPTSWTPSPAYAYNSSGGAINFTRLSPGSYRVDFEGLSRPGITLSNPLGNGSETVIATAYSQDTPGVVCNALSWFSWGSVNRLTARVDCVNSATNQFVDSRFNILVVGDGALPAPSAFAFADKPTAAQYTPDPKWSYTSGPGVLGVAHNPFVGGWDWRMGTGAPAGKVHLVNAHANDVAPTRDLCKIAEYKSLGASVRCFDNDGVPRDLKYQVLQLSRGRAGKRFGFAWADQHTRRDTTAYAPHASYAYNSSGGAVHVQRYRTGVYAVRFRGLQGAWYGPAANVQVSSFGPTFTSCSVHSWYDETPPSQSGLLVWVQCADQNGQPADSRFNVMVIE